MEGPQMRLEESGWCKVDSLVLVGSEEMATR